VQAIALAVTGIGPVQAAAVHRQGCSGAFYVFSIFFSGIFFEVLGWIRLSSNQ
jgi:hypothetical protein